MAIKQQRRLCHMLVGADLVATGGCGYGVTILMGVAVGISGEGGVEGLRDGGKGERNGWKQDDHR